MSGRRRAHGEGSLHRRKDGTWAGVLDLGWVEGKRRRKYVYAPTEREAAAKLAELKRALERGQNLLQNTPTVEQWTHTWLTDIKAHDGTRPATVRSYGEMTRCHIVPILGKVKLDRLTPSDVQRLLTARRDQVSPATLAKIHGVLRAALSDAERLDLVPRNVAKVVRGPRIGTTDRRTLTLDEARRFLDHAATERLEAVFVLALTTGLRRGEILGLHHDDVDLDRGVLRVRHAIQRIDGRLQLVPAKTAGSHRSIPIPKLAVAALHRNAQLQAEERAAAGDTWQERGLAISTTHGTPIEPRNVNRVFYRLRDSADLPWLRLHDLRHACATFLLTSGVDPRTVMSVLGHSTMRQTMERYGHALPDRLRDAADTMDERLS